MTAPLLTSPTLLTSPALLTSAGIPDVPPGTGTSGKFALRATISTAGPCGVVIPHALPVSQTATISFALRLSVRPTAVTVSVAYADFTGNPLTPTTVTLTADDINRSIDRFDRQVVHVTAPSSAATVGTIKLVADGLPADGYLDLDAVLIEKGTTDGEYFDGDTFGGTWAGVAHLSASLLAPVQDILDGECPLDVPVRYEAYNPALVGGRVASQAATLDSGERTWLTHPTAPDQPLEAKVTQTPDEEHVLEQGIFPILDSEYPVVVSASIRRAPAGALELLVESFAERNRYLREVFANGTPVLMRTPNRYGYDDGRWIVLGTISEVVDGRKPWQQVRTLQAGYQVVESPADTLVA